MKTKAAQALSRRARAGASSPYVPRGVRVAIAIRFADAPHWFPVATNGPTRLMRPAQKEGYVRVQKKLAHRHFYEKVVGAIPADKELDHLCRITGCCAPGCMEPVSGRTNILRGQSPHAINARRTHCENGHPLVGDNLRLADGGAKRRCRECSRIHSVRFQRGLLAKARERGMTKRAYIKEVYGRSSKW